jgi:hypothetical protein
VEGLVSLSCHESCDVFLIRCFGDSFAERAWGGSYIVKLGCVTPRGRYFTLSVEKAYK